jgi:hypothetical protein
MPARRAHVEQDRTVIGGIRRRSLGSGLKTEKEIGFVVAVHVTRSE